MKHYTKEDIIRIVNEEDIEFIRLQFTDIFGPSFPPSSPFLSQEAPETL